MIEALRGGTTSLKLTSSRSPQSSTSSFSIPSPLRSQHSDSVICYLFVLQHTTCLVSGFLCVYLIMTVEYNSHYSHFISVPQYINGCAVAQPGPSCRTSASSQATAHVRVCYGTTTAAPWMCCGLAVHCCHLLSYGLLIDALQHSSCCAVGGLLQQ